MIELNREQELALLGWRVVPSPAHSTGKACRRPIWPMNSAIRSSAEKCGAFVTCMRWRAAGMHRYIRGSRPYP